MGREAQGHIQKQFIFGQILCICCRLDPAHNNEEEHPNVAFHQPTTGNIGVVFLWTRNSTPVGFWTNSSQQQSSDTRRSSLYPITPSYAATATTTSLPQRVCAIRSASYADNATYAAYASDSSFSRHLHGWTWSQTSRPAWPGTQWSYATSLYWLCSYPNISRQLIWRFFVCFFNPYYISPSVRICLRSNEAKSHRNEGCFKATLSCRG